MPSDEYAPKSDANRAWLAEMLEQTRLYHSSQEYLDLLDFMARMGNFSPFNALLLRIQRPGLAWAASRWDWKIRFEREVKADARPLLILWPFGPVALVYDVLDTEGQPLPEAASQMFRATGPVTKAQMQGWVKRLGRKNILVEMRDWGDAKAGEIICEVPAKQAHVCASTAIMIPMSSLRPWLTNWVISSWGTWGWISITRYRRSTLSRPAPPNLKRSRFLTWCASAGEWRPGRIVTWWTTPSQGPRLMPLTWIA